VTTRRRQENVPPGPVAAADDRGKGNGVKTEKEIREEIRRIKSAVPDFSGYWIGELAAAIYALDWALDKAPEAPSGDIGRGRGGHEKVAANLVRLAEKQTSRARQRKTASRSAKRPGAKS
jgi:hypothetical protein